jgi:hypothetical protein
LVYWTNFTYPNEVGLNIPKTKNYARIKHVLRRDRWVSFSAGLSTITSEDDVFIFYLTEWIFFRGDVIRDIGEKGVRSVYKKVKTIDNDFRKPFKGL